MTEPTNSEEHEHTANEALAKSVMDFIGGIGDSQGQEESLDAFTNRMMQPLLDPTIMKMSKGLIEAESRIIQCLQRLQRTEVRRKE